MSSPLVSIIIPSYNRAHIIGESLDSVKNQTYQNWECIVVDDGSTDNTLAVVKRYAEDDSRFKVFQRDREPKGAPTCRNIGFNKCEGSYIQYLDSDDLLYKDKIFDQINFLKIHTNCDGVFGDWDEGIPEKKQWIRTYKNQDLISYILIGRSIVNFSFLFKKELINSIGGWDEQIKRNQEMDFYLSALMKDVDFQYFEMNCGLWRKHDSFRISQVTRFSDIIYFYKKWENILSSHHKWTEELAKGLASNYLWLLRANKAQNKKDGIVLLKEINRLNNQLLLNKKSRKIRVLKLIISDNLIFQLLLFKYRLFSTTYI